MTQRGQFARPVVRVVTGLDSDEARRKLGKKWQHPRKLQPTAQNSFARTVHSMNLKNRLRDIQTNRSNILHRGSLFRLNPAKIITERVESRPQDHLRTVRSRRDIQLSGHQLKSLFWHEVHNHIETSKEEGSGIWDDPQCMMKPKRSLNHNPILVIQAMTGGTHCVQKALSSGDKADQKQKIAELISLFSKMGK